MALSRKAALAQDTETTRKVRHKPPLNDSATSIATAKKASSDSMPGGHQMHSAIFASPCCSQCVRQLPGVPFALDNIVCRECYGLERYAEAGTQKSLPSTETSSGTDEKSSDA